jgi:hypothetical protein
VIQSQLRSIITSDPSHRWPVQNISIGNCHIGSAPAFGSNTAIGNGIPTPDDCDGVELGHSVHPAGLPGREDDRIDESESDVGHKRSETECEHGDPFAE